jgi:putative tricarboxylic transport membrane protein
VETPEWAEYIESNYLAENIQWGDDFQAFLKETVAEFETTLEEAGAL